MQLVFNLLFIEYNRCFFPEQIVAFIGLLDRVLCKRKMASKIFLKMESQGTSEVILLIYSFDTTKL